MHKRLLLLAAMVLAGVTLGPSTASAYRVSKNNPYRSFNIHGHNYGSYRWERQNWQRRVSTPHVVPSRVAPPRVVPPRVRVISPGWRR